ncbi:MAG TPA: hypothetical protein VJQ46_16400 [Gemmatimonadales bacterium]|nr:hypothetical protein [Gemmatimonadales bacterium]
MSRIVMAHEPPPAGVTVNVATYCELRGGFVAGALSGLTVAQLAFDVLAVMSPVNCTLAVRVPVLVGGMVNASEAGVTASGAELVDLSSGSAGVSRSQPAPRSTAADTSA